MQIPFITAEELDRYLPYGELIATLQLAFTQGDYRSPTRHHHEYGVGQSNTLLLMPSWQQQGNLGVKLVTVTPDNQLRKLPTVQAIYVLFDTSTGTPILMVDGNELTKRRTVAVSALASKFLSLSDSKSLLIIGTGAVASALAAAHSKVRTLETIKVWGRDLAKAQRLVSSLNNQGFQASVLSALDHGIADFDIISAATLSKQPLILGQYLRAGQHIDLIGSFKPNMREADDQVITRSNIYVDTQAALEESGDLKLPLQSGILLPQDIKSDLSKLCKDPILGRSQAQDITCFKSVGAAVEDLAAANLVWSKYKKL